MLVKSSVRINCLPPPPLTKTVCVYCVPYTLYTLPKFSKDHYSKADCRLGGFPFASQYNGTVIGNLKAELNSVYPREFRYFA